MYLNLSENKNVHLENIIINNYSHPSKGVFILENNTDIYGNKNKFNMFFCISIFK